jgi:hypothetical protein
MVVSAAYSVPHPCFQAASPSGTDPSAPPITARAATGESLYVEGRSGAAAAPQPSRASAGQQIQGAIPASLLRREGQPEVVPKAAAPSIKPLQPTLGPRGTCDADGGECSTKGRDQERPAAEPPGKVDRATAAEEDSATASVDPQTAAHNSIAIQMAVTQVRATCRVCGRVPLQPA